MADVTDALLDSIIASYLRDGSAPTTAWEVYQMAWRLRHDKQHPEVSERERALEEALRAFMTHFGMDEDEWTKPTFDQGRAALAPRAAAPHTADETRVDGEKQR